MKKPNIYKLISEKYLQNNYINKKKLPIKYPFRLCIVGGSGVGKTQSLIWFIERSKAFNKMYLYAKKLDQPLYLYLIDEWKNRSKEQKQALIKYSEELEQVFSLDEIDESIQNLIIFDDRIVEKNLRHVEELFIRGRKSNCSIVFISQSYFAISRRISQNSNYCLLNKGLLGKDLVNIATAHSGSVDSKELRDIYIKSTKDSDLVLIDVINSNLYKKFGIY